jgi:hypothetical protein
MGVSSLLNNAPLVVIPNRDAFCRGEESAFSLAFCTNADALLRSA